VEQELPKAIQEELELAEAIEKQIAAEVATPNKGNTDQPKADPAQFPAPEVAETVTEPTPQQAETVSQGDDGYKQKFEVLTGKYNAEVPRLHQQLKEQSSALDRLQAEMESLKAKPVEPEIPKESLVTSKDEDTFGSDLIDLARRVTKDEVGVVLQRIGQVESMLKNIAELPRRVDQVVQQQAENQEQRFWGTVSQQIPDWTSVDSDPRWIEWLNLTPPFALKSYRELASDAIQAGQAGPIVELVKAWKQQAGIATANATQANNKQELARQVAPTKQAGSQVPQGKKIWTAAEYERVFDPRLLGGEMSEAEIEALQAEADLAVQEGRVKW
jgi:hypothetical protein